MHLRVTVILLYAVAIFAGWFGGVRPAGAQTPSSQFMYEQRLSGLEARVSNLQRAAPGNPVVDVGAASFLFGAFCALWAQNTRRSAWLWFFLGLFFNVIAVIVLLVKNSNDRVRRHRANLAKRFHPPGSAPVQPPR